MVAVSGGADSVALLDILSSLEEFSLNLIPAHMNHLLRGGESDADEEFVRQLAFGYGLTAITKRLDVKGIAKKERRSLEDAGRLARYAFLDDVAAAHGTRAVALAHHGDDQAETVLLRLLRGSGGSGLCAMAPSSAGRYVRPLLCLRRNEIEEYLKERGLSWREDGSNRNVEFLRNRIRHELIPLLESYNPAVSERLAATAEALAADEEVLAVLTREAFDRHTLPGKGGVRLSIPGVLKEPAAIRMRIFREAIRVAKGDLARISFRNLKNIDGLVSSESPNAVISLPDGLRASRRYGEISFSTEVETPPQWTDEIIVEGPGIYPLPGGGSLSVDFSDPPEDLRHVPAMTEYFNPQEAPFPWRVRTFRPGDRISPLGMSGHKKVKDLFIDEKVPVLDRRRIPLVFCADTLLWVAGLKRAGAAVIKTKTSKTVRVELIAAS